MQNLIDFSTYDDAALSGVIMAKNMSPDLRGRALMERAKRLKASQFTAAPAAAPAAAPVASANPAASSMGTGFVMESEDTAPSPAPLPDPTADIAKGADTAIKASKAKRAERAAAAAGPAPQLKPPVPDAPAAAAPQNTAANFMDSVREFTKNAEDGPLTAEDKGLALAQFGARLMGSKNPSFFGGVGEAGSATIDDLGKLRARRAEAAARRAAMGIDVAGKAASLGQEDTKLAQSQKQLEAETKYREGVLANQKEELGIKDRAAKSEISRNSAYASNLGKSVSTDENGNAVVIDATTGKGVPVTGPDGKPIKASKLSSGAGKAASTTMAIIERNLTAQLGRQPTIKELADAKHQFDSMSPDRKRIKLLEIGAKTGLTKEEIIEAADYYGGDVDGGLKSVVPKPAAGGGGGKMSAAEIKESLDNARAAIAKGGDRSQIIKRLQANGIDASGL